MPFNLRNLAKYNNTLKTAKQKEQWLAIANSTLNRCLEQGKSQSECDADAIKIANGVLASQKQSKPTGLRECTSNKSCANCQYHNLGLCELYNYLTDDNQTCKMWMPTFKNSVKAIPQKYAHIDFVPPKSVQTAAKRALEWRSQYNRGGTPVGIARARDLSNGKQLSPDTIKRMSSFFARHGNNRTEHFDLRDGEPTTWRIAWDLWGGDPGKTWADKISRQMEAIDEKS